MFKLKNMMQAKPNRVKATTTMEAHGDYTILNKTFPNNGSHGINISNQSYVWV